MNKCKLGDLFYIKQGYAFKSEKYVSHSNYLLCTLANFSESNNFKFSSEKATYYPDVFSHEFILCENDLIIPLTEQVVGLFGNTAFVPKTEGFQFVLNQRVGKIIPYEEKADKLFLHYLLSTQLVRDQIEATASGTKQRNTSPDKIYDVTVWVPNIDQQRIIGRYLYSLEQKCNVNNKICSELETMAKTLYDYWFAQFDFPDENGKPYRTSGGEVVWNEQLKREIPKGWKVTNIGNLTTVVTGKEDANFSSPNGKYKFFTCSQEALLCDTPAFSGQAVLIAGNGDFNVKHYSGEFNAYQRTYVLIPENQVYYGAMYISAKNQIQAFKNGSNGSIVKFITKGDVENIPFILPNDDSIFHQINKLIEKIELCERENEELTKLRDWLLPMLMNGQATVVDAEEDAGKVIPYTPQTVEVRQAARNFGDAKTDDTADLVQAYLRRKQHDSKTQKRN